MYTLKNTVLYNILLDIFTYLNYNELIHCEEVCQFWYFVLNDFNVLDRCEMRCFYTHENINKCILGVGLIKIRIWKLISPFDGIDVLIIGCKQWLFLMSNRWKTRRK